MANLAGVKSEKPLKNENFQKILGGSRSALHGALKIVVIGRELGQI